jgi:hypothetical protein
MDTTRPASNLAQLARTFTARAQPISGSSALDATDEQAIEVEVRILTTVHDAVRARAEAQGQQVADVARAVLFQAAAHVTNRQIQEFRERRADLVATAKEGARKRAARRLEAGLLTAEEVEARVERAGQAAARSRLGLRDYLGPDARHRLRFTAPSGPYRTAAEAILAGGNTIVSVVEQGLKAYAQTGCL